jgi:hypothetical protein
MDQHYINHHGQHIDKPPIVVSAAYQPQPLPAKINSSPPSVMRAVSSQVKEGRLESTQRAIVVAYEKFPRQVGVTPVYVIKREFVYFQTNNQVSPFYTQPPITPALGQPVEPPPVIAEQNGEQNNQRRLAFEESTERQTHENQNKPLREVDPQTSFMQDCLEWVRSFKECNAIWVSDLKPSEVK